VAALTAAVNDLQTAETAALSRAKGAATVRDDKRVVVVGLLQQLRGYVQAIADATPENGAAIIESAGLAVFGESVAKLANTSFGLGQDGFRGSTGPRQQGLPW
jgi:hypothetical protein